MSKTKIEIDAKGEKLGRLSSKIAKMLSGKNNTDYKPNVVPEIVIEISNADKLDITTKKKKEKIYDRYTGYFGGRKTETLEELIEKKGIEEAIRKAIYGMLAPNKLRNIKMKNITFKKQ